MLHLEQEIAELLDDLDQLTQQACPGLRQTYGIGTDGAATLLVTVGDHPERLRSDAAFASLCGVSPLPVSSGKTNRHRLNRGGNRQANATLHRIVVVRLRWQEQTKAYAARRVKEGAAKPRSCVVSNASSHGRCSSPSWPPPDANRCRLSDSGQPGSGQGNHRLFHGAVVALAIRSRPLHLYGINKDAGGG